MTSGRCGLCGAVFGKTGMGRHLRACRGVRHVPAHPASPHGLLLAVEAYRLEDYWLYVETSAPATWGDLDAFLRDTWVECCGHLSEFQHEGVRYGSWGLEGLRDRGMSSRLSRSVAPGARIRYRYDFGTTTELALRVVMGLGSARGDRRVRLLARNDPPEIRCGVCGRPATQVCRQCRWEDAGWLCDACARGHPCGDEYLLPVVNSPRVGLCGYTG